MSEPDLLKEIMDLWGIEDRGPCGRPVKATGEPCTSRKDQFVPVACFSHMDRTERADRQRLEREGRVAGQKKWEALEPACWGWPIPTDEELKARFLKRHPASNWAEERDTWVIFYFEDWHEERCALCGRNEGRLVEDHDHDTGFVRGYLCSGCNTAEGMQRSRRGGPYMKYRERNPATMLGIEMLYSRW